MASEATPFRNVLAYAIGGGWGSEIKDDKNDVAVSIIRGTDFIKMQNGHYGEVPSRFESSSKVEKRKLQIGDIVLEVSGGSPTRGQTTGRTYLVTEETLSNFRQPVIPASFCRLVRVDVKKVLPRFAYYWLQDMYLSGRAGLYENQSTGISNFQFERFLDAEALKLPSLEEQRAIAETLGSLDDRIANLRRVNVTLQAIAAALFKSRFVDFDGVPPEDMQKSELGLIPKGWRAEEVGKLVQCVGGATPSTKDETFWNGGLHHWATPKDLSGLQAPILITTERRITDAGVARISSGLLPAGTLLMSSRAPIGYLAIAAVPVAINQGFIAMLPGGALSPVWLLFWAQVNMEAVKQKANGSTFMEISKAAFRPIKVALPPPDTLVQFDEVAAPMLERIQNNERHIAILAAIRDALLPRLLSGQLRVPQ